MPFNQVSNLLNTAFNPLLPPCNSVGVFSLLRLFPPQRGEESSLPHGGADDGVHQLQTARPSPERDPLPAPQSRTGPAAGGQVRAQRLALTERWAPRAPLSAEIEKAYRYTGKHRNASSAAVQPR